MRWERAQSHFLEATVSLSNLPASWNKIQAMRELAGFRDCSETASHMCMGLCFLQQLGWASGSHVVLEREVGRAWAWCVSSSICLSSQTWKSEGFFALYKGFWPNWLRLGPWNIIVSFPMLLGGDGVGQRENPAGKGRAELTPQWGALGTLMGTADGPCRASEGLAETLHGLGCRRFLDELLFGRELWGTFCC